MPRRSTFKMRSNVSRSTSAVGSRLPVCVTAAQLTAQSRRPELAVARATAAAISSGSETSTRTNRAVPPDDEISSVAARPSSSLRSAIQTSAPSWAKSSPVARPMPVAPPVMKAIFPSSSIVPPSVSAVGEGGPSAQWLRSLPASTGRATPVM